MYRKLKDTEIEVLQHQACTAEDWNEILVKEGFIPESISNTQFAGKVKLGVFSRKVLVEKGILKPSGIRSAYIENCTISDNVFISNVGSLVNYDVSENVALENIGTLIVNGESTFGN